MARQDQKFARNPETTGNTKISRNPETAGSSRTMRNAKDATEKMLEAENDVFADIMNVLLFGGRRNVAENELEQALPRSIYKVDGRLREQERDTAKYWRKVSIRIAFLGLENQTEPDADMPLRIISYDGAVYRNQLDYTVGEDEVMAERDSLNEVQAETGILSSGERQGMVGKRRVSRRRKRRHRYPAVTLVLYFGTDRHWDKSLTLHGALGEIPEDLKPYVNDYRVNLVEVAWLTDEQVEMFQSDFRVVADYFVQKRKNKDYQPSTVQLTHVQEVLQLMAALTGDNRFEEAYHRSREEGAEARNMCEVLDKVENRGVQRGLEQGLEQGLERKLIALIKKKIQKNKSISEIADALEETEEDIQKIYDTILQMGMDTPDAEIYKRLHEQE